MISEMLRFVAQPKQATHSVALFISAMARSITFESRTFGADPMDILERKQAEEANARKRAEESKANAPKRRTLTVRKGWAARKAIEALFDIPAAPRSEA